MNLNKVIIAPDSFKGVLSSKEVADIIAGEVEKAYPDCEIVKMPIADGGEGSVDAILSAIGGEKYTTQVLSPDDRQIDASFGIAANGVAIIEMAQSSGLTRQIGLHPMTSSTYGFGQLILAALDRVESGLQDSIDGGLGARESLSAFESSGVRESFSTFESLGTREFILCIGGSATTDGGCGMAAALGVRFINKQGNSFIPCGQTLCDIVKIDCDGIDKRVAGSSFTVMCDVDNPLFGVRGAAHVYAPQKGASPEQVLFLDEGLRHYGALLERIMAPHKQNTGEPSPCVCANLSDIPGAGAAGGLGAGCMVFLGAKLMSGIDMILQLCDFNKHVLDADLIITGEGKLDVQSFQGKVLSGILRQAQGVPVWSICGVSDCDESMLRGHYVTVFEASEGISQEESMRNGEQYLRVAARRAIERGGSA